MFQRLTGSALAGLGATLMMEYVSSWLYRGEADAAREREEQLRGSGMPTTTLVRKAADAMGRELDDEKAQKLGMVLHYAFGAAGGPTANLLRRRGMSPLRSGLAVASAMELVADQGVNYALGLTAGPKDWPWQAQARGAAAHVAYGLTLGLMLGASSD